MHPVAVKEGAPIDYKFYCFHGRVAFLHTDTGRYGSHKRNFYDREWNSLPVKLTQPNGPPLPRPVQLNEMIGIAERISADFVFARIDLYAVGDAAIKFGEITLAPGNATSPFDPVSFDIEAGDLLKLSA